MEKMEIMEKLATVIIDGDEDGAREGAKEALANEIDPLEAVEEGLSMGCQSLATSLSRGKSFFQSF